MILKLGSNILYKKLIKDGDLSSLFFFNFYQIIACLISVFLGWNYFGLFFIYFLFVGFKFLDTVELKSKNNFLKFILNSFIFILLWHFGVIFWMFKIESGIYGFFISSLIYIIPFLIYVFVVKIIGKNIAFFIPIMILFETFLDKSNFSFPWLIIGNSMSNSISLIQWYKFTGVIGGSILLLLISYFLYRRNFFNLLFLFIPFSISAISFHKSFLEIKKNEKLEIITFNTEKYNLRNENQSNNDKLSFYIHKKTKFFRGDFLIIPEQTLRSIKYSTFKSELSYKYLKNIINEKKIKNIFVGISGFYTKNKLANSIAFLNNEKVLLKNKNKLVPYTEFTPVFLRKMLDRYSYEFETKDSLKEIKKALSVLPLICYESIYSDYVANNSKDADKIILIASENFLNNSYFGEIQYNNIISLRGIENGLFIIKASNCGKSITFDDNGNKIKVSENEINFFQIPKTLKLKTTFFVRFYNYYNLNIFISIGLFLLLTLKTYVYD